MSAMETPTAEPARANIRRAWTPQEDQILQREAEIQLQHGSLRDWKLIATKLPCRSNKDCRKRWSKICDSVNKGPWNRREDKALEEAIAQVGPQWISVAKRVGTRHADQCAKRWRHFLDPDLDHSQWEPEDDARLWAAVSKYGSNWRKVVEEEFSERSPTNVKNRYAVIKNLRRREKKSSATSAGADAAEGVEATTSLFSKAVNNGGHGSTPSNTNASTASPESCMDFENAVYSAGSMDDDFGFFIHDSLTPQTLPSSTSMGTLTDPESSTSGFASDSHCTTLAPASTMRMQHSNNATTLSAEEHIPDRRDYGSLALGQFPHMESGVTNNFGNEAQDEIYREPQNNSLGDGWFPAGMEGLNGEAASIKTTSLASDSAHTMYESKRVSLFLEDMQPETANRVTSMLLNSNVDVKMKMTVQ
ncbi:hypothetical protein N7G274_001233 [Stereocaulon virgatum]|uniref:Uncharacterized protein n=1 Tax=Stereocaulon virgatum TaxID=373712 RepID=A0ABR4ANU8_9LECA